MKTMIQRTTLKFFCASIFLTISCMTCTGCSVVKDTLQQIKDEAKNEPHLSFEAKTYNDAVDKFFVALDAGDKNAMIEMFSANVRSKDADLDAQMEKLLEIYPGPTDACGRNGNLVQGSYSRHYGKHISTVEDTFPVLSNGTYYWWSFQLVYENDEEEDEIGISKIVFYSAEEYCGIYYDENSVTPDAIGLSIYADDILDCEVRSIAGFPYKYTPTDTVLDEEEVKTWLENSNSYTEFVQKFGEPNAVNIYYCYELPQENGQPRYLQLSVDEDIDSIRHASAMDAFGWIYNIWDRDE